MLLAVWMVNVKYNKQMYPFAMNGQTGEFIGNIPLDKKKVLKYLIINELENKVIKEQKQERKRHGNKR